MNAHRTLPVVVGIDASRSSHEALRWAAGDAERRGAPLSIVHAVFTPLAYGPGLSFTKPDFDRLEAEGAELLSRAARNVSETSPELEVRTELVRAPRAPALIDKSKDAQMVVIGSRGLGAIGRGLVGSVGSSLARHAHRPVAVLHYRANDPWNLSRPRRAVVVGVDGSENSLPAIEVAFEEASMRSSKIIAVHSWADDGRFLHVGDWDAVANTEEALLAESLAGYAERYPDVPVEKIIVKNNPARHLRDFSDDAELLVVGSHGRGGFAGMTLGSTSQELLHSVTCPLIIARTTA
ncbi:universal stress protein [Antrihabitans sp. YC2-6]|uniref:universal stress protein n=1 Tax=Antrihabitans sp. YC2-6 TaxID=2799498 RepID=UPI0018F72675|nr:universal stress protein [Antrihabitans sp. YC2-6]MBJ8347037.1 universal stress protein [Antrihabitans sp. YC2-6]